jgi:hypothetical protein
VRLRQRDVRLLSTGPIATLGEKLDSIHEGDPEEVHRQVDGAAATFLRAGVVPLGRSGGEDLELPARCEDVPAAAARVLDGHVQWVGLAVDREQRQDFFAGDIAKGSQRCSSK